MPPRCPVNSNTLPSESEQPIRLGRSEKAIVAAVLVLAAFWLTRLGVRPVQDADAWLHLRIGAYLNAGNSFAGVGDPWSVTATRTYLPTQWLPERIGALAYSHWGLPGVALLRSAGVLILMVTLYFCCRRLADQVPAMLAATAGFIACSGALAERPQLVSLSLLAIWTVGWLTPRRSRKSKWWLIPLIWIWAMTHGLWIIGLAVAVAIGVGRYFDHRDSQQLRHDVGLVASCTAAICLTPSGPALLLAPLITSRTATEIVQEWQPLPWNDPLLIIGLAPGLLLIILWGWRRAHPTWSRALVLALALGCALSMGRLVAVAAVIEALLLAEALQRLRGRSSLLTARVEVLAAAAFAGTALLVLGLASFEVASSPATSYPASLSPALKQLPPGAVVVPDQALSGWLLWTAPQARTVIDLRAEIYDRSAISEYLELVHGRGSLKTYAARHDVTVALLPSTSPLLVQLSRDASWTLLGRDRGYILWRRTGQ